MSGLVIPKGEGALEAVLEEVLELFHNRCEPAGVICGDPGVRGGESGESRFEFDLDRVDVGRLFLVLIDTIFLIVSEISLILSSKLPINNFP